MPKYLVRASLTREGVQGTLSEGGTKRRAAIEGLVRSVGGTLESFYYAFGADDVFSVIDLPDNVSAATASLAVTAAGGARVNVTALLTPEELDQVSQRSAAYRPPGS